MAPPRLSGLASAVSRRIKVARHHGDRVFCPVCGHGFARFKDAHRPNAVCWWCGSHERHRAQWLLFEGRPELLGNAGSLLHFAPEWALRRRLEGVERLRYVTADLFEPGVDLRLDLMALELPDASFDAVICSHVLEHLPDDGAAMRELRRIATPEGWCLIMVPLDLSRDETYEDPALTLPEERRRAFGQSDHLRFYAPDIADRLTKAGFAVEQIRPDDEFGESVIERCRLAKDDHIFLCRPDVAASSASS